MAEPEAFTFLAEAFFFLCYEMLTSLVVIFCLEMFIFSLSHMLLLCRKRNKKLIIVSVDKQKILPSLNNVRVINNHLLNFKSF